MATFRKNKQGDWVVLGTSDEVTPGTFCRVSKKDGSVRRLFITEVGAPFDVSGTSMVYGYIGTAPRTERKTKAPRSESPREENFELPW